MAVAVTDAVSDVGAARRVSAWHFVRLKLRVMGNNFRGQDWRVGLFAVGAAVGFWLAAFGFSIFAAPGFAGNDQYATLLAAMGGGLLVLCWLLLPLVFFGVDETLDPARFALLPLPRRTLVTGLFTAALVSVPAVAVLLAASGLIFTAGVFGGWPAALTQTVGVLAGLLLCVAAARAVTSGFATMLRSRRVRDLAAVLLAGAAALIAPVQLAATAALQDADWDRLAAVAAVVGWTPFGAPWTMGIEVAQGRVWAAPVKLLITAVTVAALLLWWSRSLESAMIGAASSGRTSTRSPTTGTAVTQLFPRLLGWLPRSRFGALVAREARYWWRDARRRANLITLAVVGLFVPVMLNLGSAGLTGGGGTPESPSPVLATLSMVFVGVLAAATLANQFGFDGSAYATHVVVGVPGAEELRARIAAFSLYLLPLVLVISGVLALLVLGQPGWIGLTAGSLLATFGAGLAINTLLSVLAAYSLPETSNPFAMNSGAGVARSLLAILSLLASAVAAIPMVVAAALLGDVWLWLALPFGAAYGLGAALLGAYLAGDVLDRRQPELLATITPRR
ncbi:hypothetical protein [Salinispora vitiensis]|uniref:hypothetical protein n=1 Tax=Salinispora vitiensis TaxID=999544 RepID=UPI00037CDE80|nr:hypothetical protein [Salinispora vitiensis]